MYWAISLFFLNSFVSPNFSTNRMRVSRFSSPATASSYEARTSGVIGRDSKRWRTTIDVLTSEVKAACGRLADAGIPLGAQTVLLKGVNDDPAVMIRLVHQLLLARVKPYYLYQADLTRGTNHFRTSVETGLEIIKALQGHTSGMGVPHFVIDAPGGGGKIPLLPSDYLVSLTPEEAILTNYEGKTYIYPQPPQPGGNGKRRELPMVAAPSSSATGCGMADAMLG